MLDKNKDIAVYHAKVRSLKEVDYFLFQEKLTLLINEYHDAASQKQWAQFCEDLDNDREKEPMKFLIMKLAFQCMEAPVTYLQLHEFIVLMRDLKSAYGSGGIYLDILEANVNAGDRKLENYITILNLLIELKEEEGITKKTTALLPDLKKVLQYLYSTQKICFDRKYPSGNIDAVLNKFATADKITRFPLTKEVLQSLKPDYLGIKACLDQIRPFSQEELKRQFHEAAKSWRDTKDTNVKDTKAKQRVLAIIIETLRRPPYYIQPYDEQIIALLALIREDQASAKQVLGRLAQIKAGEGKSTVFAMLIAFTAAEGDFVDMITSSQSLAIRDYEKYRPFLESLGLTSSHICHANPQRSHFEAQILYGTSSDFHFALLRDGLNEEKLRCSRCLGGELIKRTCDSAIFDETDCLILDKTGIARIAGPGTENNAWVYKPILNFVEKVIQNQPANKTTVASLRKSMEASIPERYKPILARIKDAKLLKWIESAQIAFYHRIENRDYKVEDGDIHIVDFKITGETEEGCQWQHGVHQFLQVKHGILPTPETLTIASVANPTYYARYRKRNGASGTLGELAEREEMQEMYVEDIFDVPPHLPCQRITLPAQLLPTASDQFKAILARIKKNQEAGRPILILFESIKETLAFSKFLRDQQVPVDHQVLNGKQSESEEYIVAHAGEAKKVTIATNLAGRGTDIKLPKEIEKAGGLHQVFAFYPENSRVEEQGVARGARQGEQGSCEMILQENDPHITSLLATSLADIIKWLGAKSVEDKMAILNDLRTRKIQHDSKRRCYFSKLETLYFARLEQFFGALDALRLNLHAPDFKQQLKQAASAQPTTKPCAFPVDIKLPHWAAVYEKAKILATEQAIGKTVDWSPFIEQYSAAFINNFKQCWAIFYSQLSDEVENMEIPVAAKFIAHSYEKLDLLARCSPDVILSSLNDLLYKAVTPQKEQAPEPSLASSMSFFPRKPKDLHTDAANVYKEGARLSKEDQKKGALKYEEALKLSQSAFDYYCAITDKGVKSIEVGNCYDLQASCYRELGRVVESLTACENAIAIFAELAPSGTLLSEKDHIITKYHSCLQKSGLDVDLLYQRAVDLYKTEKIENRRAATYLLLYLIEKRPEANKKQRGNCYSTLASCYRETGFMDKAFEACQKALDEFNTASKDVLTPKQKENAIKNVMTKLETIKPPANLRKVI